MTTFSTPPFLLLLLVLILIFGGLRCDVQLWNSDDPFGNRIPFGSLLLQETEDEQVIAENKEPCLGCPEKLSFDLDGVVPLVEMAVRDVQSEHHRKQVLLELVDLERQIVSGVQYGVTVKVGSAVCPADADPSLADCSLDASVRHVYCRVDFLQKPWLSRAMHIVRNNCTLKAYAYPEEHETSGGLKEMPPDHLSDMESQIIPKRDDNEMINNDVTAYYLFDEGRSDKEEVRRTVRDLNTSEDSRSNDTSSSEERLRVVRAADSSSSSSSSSDYNNGNNNDKDDDKKKDGLEKSSKKKADGDEKNDDDDTSSSSSSSDDNNSIHKHNRKRAATELDPAEENALLRNVAVHVTAALDSTDDDGLRQIPLHVAKTKKSILEGLVYDLKLHVATSNCLETADAPTTDNLLSDHSDNNDPCALDLIPGSVKLCRAIVYVPETFGEVRVLGVRCYGAARQARDVGAALHVSPHSVLHVMDAMQLLDDRTDYPTRMKPVKIRHAIKQGPDDNFYTIGVLMGMSVCAKGSDTAIELCPLDRHYPLVECKFLIWNRGAMLGADAERVVRCKNGMHYTLGSKRSKRQVKVGGINPQSVDDPEVVKTAQTAVMQLDRASSHGTKYKIVRIHEATKQLVAGFLYRIRAELILTDCPKATTGDPNLCAAAKEAEPRVCDIEVWTRPWIKTGGTETTIKCGEEISKFKTRRSAPRFDASLLCMS